MQDHTVKGQGEETRWRIREKGRRYSRSDILNIKERKCFERKYILEFETKENTKTQQKTSDGHMNHCTKKQVRTVLYGMLTKVF